MAGRDHGMDFAQEVLGSHLAPVPVAVTWEGCISSSGWSRWHSVVVVQTSIMLRGWSRAGRRT